MTLLSNTEFLKATAELFDSAQQSRSSLYITQKRLTPNDPVQGSEGTKAEVSKFLQDTPILPDSRAIKSETSYPVLIRISDGASDKSKRKKISTQVQPEQLSKFWKEYSSVFKAGAVGLKKKEKGKKKKRKATK